MPLFIRWLRTPRFVSILILGKLRSRYLLGFFLTWPLVPQASEFVLRDYCPPSFELTAQTTCKLRTRYELYDSVQSRGLGGTQTALPNARDGFTPQQIDLGRYLFFDPVLSGDGSLACASCHDPAKSLADGRARSVGMHGQEINRAAPTLWNVAFLQRFFWDSRATSLEEQMQGPLYSEQEMANTPEKLLATLNGIPTYRQLFQQAYGGAALSKPDVPKPDSSNSSVEELKDRAAFDITLAQIYTALAAFQTSLISLNSRYDHYAHGHHAALNKNEIAGLNIFRSFVSRCAECHTPPLFTNGEIAVIGAPEPEGLDLDIGAEKTYAAPALRAGFKVPTLRNIARTAPYMHSGRFASLREVVEFYNGGRGHAVPDGVKLQLHWHISSPDLREEELDRLVDFLATLTDESLSPQIPVLLPSGLTAVVLPQVFHHSHQR